MMTKRKGELPNWNLKQHLGKTVNRTAEQEQELQEKKEELAELEGEEQQGQKPIELLE